LKKEKFFNKIKARKDFKNVWCEW